MEMHFCRRCGTALHNKNGHVYQCAGGHTIYANASPAVGIFFLSPDNSQVLLSVRGIEPHKGMLDAFGGFVDGVETLEAAVERELQEELQLTPAQYETPAYLTSGTDHYPHEGEEISFLSALYWSRLKPGVRPTPSDDVADTIVLPLHQVDLDRLHSQDIRAGILKLQAMFSH